MIIKNQIITPSHGKSLLLDVHGNETGIPKPVIIFSHGFKGFKDWGHWGLIGEYFANQGFVFIKYNFSHNGTTLENPFDFDDLESFGENNFSKELEDLDAVLNWVEQSDNPNFDRENITLIGHSRGGATSIIKSATDKRVKQLISWASVAEVDYAWKKTSFIDTWKKNGVIYVRNGRTKQDMPLKYQLYQDFILNKNKFDIRRLAIDFKKPFLIIHGNNDPAVSISAAENLNKIFQSSELELISDANHVFNGFHPYNLTTLPLETEKMLELCVTFLQKNGPT